MEITASDVKKLRDMTGAGMMACKNALIAANGNIDEAIDILRKAGAATAAKKASRIASEGLVSIALASDEKSAAMVEINCESDFVANSDVFVKLCNDIAQVALKAKTATVEELSAAKAQGGTVETLVNEATAKIGEKLALRRVCFVKSKDGILGTYTHMHGSIGVIVDIACDKPSDAVRDCAHDLAMNVAAFNPQYLYSQDVPESVLAHEKEIITDQLKQDPKNEKKPPAVLEKIAEGKLGKFFAENCAYEQTYAKDTAKSVRQFIDETAKSAGAKLHYNSFVKFTMGEGLEKRQDNLADEVNKLQNNK